MRSKFFISALALAVPMCAQATVLTFDIDGATNGVGVGQDYGDNVTSTTMGGYSYGLGSGFTPNVSVTYSGLPGPSDVNFWTTGYSDLTNVIEYEPDGAVGYEVVLLADAGFQAKLEGFDLGNWGGETTLTGLEVLDENNQVLWSQSNIVISGSGTPHLSFDFGTPLVGQLLRIHVDTTGMGGNSDNMGLDNIAFGQQPVPEPASLAALALGAAALIRRRRK